MPDYSLDNDDEFWQAPAKFDSLMKRAGSIGARSSWFALGDADTEEVPIAMVFHMEPGFIITRHTHPCERFEVVVRGSIDVGDRVLVPGDVMTSHANEMYGPKQAGPDGCTTVEVFATTSGAHHRIVEDGQGNRTSLDIITDFETAFKDKLKT